jgi:hypothetical protein
MTEEKINFFLRKGGERFPFAPPIDFSALCQLPLTHPVRMSLNEFREDVGVQLCLAHIHRAAVFDSYKLHAAVLKQMNQFEEME